GKQDGPSQELMSHKFVEPDPDDINENSKLNGKKNKYQQNQDSRKNDPFLRGNDDGTNERIMDWPYKKDDDTIEDEPKDNRRKFGGNDNRSRTTTTNNNNNGPLKDPDGNNNDTTLKYPKIPKNDND